jgi:hypothetical protein
MCFSIKIVTINTALLLRKGRSSLTTYRKMNNCTTTALHCTALTHPVEERGDDVIIGREDGR